MAAIRAATGENNFEGNARGRGDVAANWPTKIVYSGYEVGSEVLSGETVTSVHPSDSPVRAAMDAFAGKNEAITSFDLTAAYHAIDPGDPNLSEVGPGTNSIDDFGDNTFTLGAGDEYYLALGNVTELETSLEALLGHAARDDTAGAVASRPPRRRRPPWVGPTTSGDRAGVTGNPVTLTIDPTSTSGCTINGSGDVALSAPAGYLHRRRERARGHHLRARRGAQTFQVSKDTQSITFTSTPPSSPTIGGTYAVTAMGGGSSNPVTISIDASSTSGCTVDGAGRVTFAAPFGTCVIDANQAGTATYAAASEVQQTVGVGGIGQTLTFTTPAPSPASVGAPGYTPAATSSAGLGVTIALDASSSGCALSGGTVTFTGVGTCILDATQAGTTTYLPATQQQIIPVAKGASLITITSSAPKTPLAGGTYVPAGTSNTGDTVLISLGSHSTGCGMLHATVEFRGVGSCTIEYTDPGNVNYVGSTVTQQLTIGKGHVVLRTSAAPSPAHAGARVSLTATVSVAYATGIVTYTAGGKTLCAAAVHGGTATCRALITLPKGSYRIAASYSGSSSFYATTATTRVRLI